MHAGDQVSTYFIVSCSCDDGISSGREKEDFRAQGGQILTAYVCILQCDAQNQIYNKTHIASKV